MLAHCNLKQNMWLGSKQSSFLSFNALPSGGELKDAVVHWQGFVCSVFLVLIDFIISLYRFILLTLWWNISLLRIMSITSSDTKITAKYYIMCCQKDAVKIYVLFIR